MLYNLLEFFNIKKKEKFMSIFFMILSILVSIVLLIRFVAFIIGDGHVAKTFEYFGFVYAMAIAFPALSFSYGVNSGMLPSKEEKVKWFEITLLAICATFGSYLVICLNQTIWWLLSLLPNYAKVYAEYTDLFAPALKTASAVIPFIGVFKIIDYLLGVPRDDDITKGVNGFCGMKIKNKTKKEDSTFACDNVICKDIDSAKPIIVTEKKRMESTLVQGATGTGKTAMVLLPMSARDLEKKYTIREYSKRVAYDLLKQGKAYIEGPFTNEYINLNFSLNFIKPKEGYEDSFYSALKQVLLYRDKSTGEASFKDVGITVVENDGKYVDDFTNVAHNFDIDVITIDPINPNTMSMNPFAIKDPAKAASIIGDVLKSMQQNDGSKEDVFFAQVTTDAFENLSILLKEMYPLLHNGELPTLEDVLDLLYNFDKVEDMTEDMKKIPELAEKYKLLISYFEKNFYKPSLNINGYEIPGTRGSGRKDTERFLYGAITQLNNLLRHPGIKRALCGRNNVLDFDEALKNGQVITACSRKGELGVIASKAFGMFFILQFQDAVLRRTGTEDSRVPHFLYIDEFPEYINKDMEVMFTLFRKYRCGSTIAIQNLSQLEKNKDLKYYRQVVLANTKTQIIFGDMVPEDSEYWHKAFGLTKKYDTSSSYTDDTGDFVAKKSYAYKDKERFKVHKIAEHGFGLVYYKSKAANGNPVFGEGKVGFLEDTYKTKHPTKMYDFEKFMKVKPITSVSNNNDAIIHNEADDSKFASSYSSNNEPLKTYDDVLNSPDFDIDIDISTKKDN